MDPRPGLRPLGMTGERLAFRSRMGFTDHDARKGVPLRDGMLVDRICKRLGIGRE
ncbi:hypothetical protein [Microvirga pudoricolor]|uniref:hypothetical protein n=1 Tax=Microvirga pudoricolor TaxID=2778729 RepID=UPI001951B890|nr:hypothetical protein [Microvirga pudoricolor]MBM6593037.1 hypothetical protein [Microvirga pudoricolor]